MATDEEIAGELGFELPPDIDPADVPVLDAYIDATGELSVWCAYCRRWHAHANYEGHRLAHCDGETPYRRTGYVLRRVGLLTPAVKAHYQRPARRRRRSAA